MFTVKWEVRHEAGVVTRMLSAREVTIAYRDKSVQLQQSWILHGREVEAGLVILDSYSTSGLSLNTGKVYVMNEAGATVGKYLLGDDPSEGEATGLCVSVQRSMKSTRYINEDYDIFAKKLKKILAVRDGGIPLVIDGDEPNIESLDAAQIQPSHVRTCIAERMIRLGCIPASKVTVDVVGSGMKHQILHTRDLASSARSECAEWLEQIEAKGLLRRESDAA